MSTCCRLFGHALCGDDNDGALDDGGDVFLAIMMMLSKCRALRRLGVA